MSELARRPASAELAAVYQPTTFEQGWKIAQFIARSNLCPSALANKPESVWMIMSKGAELGVSAMIALAEIHIIKGRAVLSSRLMTSFVTRAPECEYFRMVHSDDVRATF